MSFPANTTGQAVQAAAPETGVTHGEAIPRQQAAVVLRRRFDGRVVVVTGGGSGLGEAMCRAFAREGGRVGVVDINEQAARKVADACQGDAKAYACDVADPVAVREMFAAVDSDLGPVEVLVNNAGIVRRDQAAQDQLLANIEAAMTGGERRSLSATTRESDEDWDRIIRVNLYGAFYCTREALNVMEPRGKGAIVNMSSLAAQLGLPIAPGYSAAKGALIGFTKAVAGDMIAAGIRVNAIAPGWIRTPMVMEEIDARLLPILLAQVPAGTIGEPEHVAALALHLCSDEASYTTGQVVSPNGGIYS
jgi:3-oxoacyl-[acyl-carrier protein] reductase